MDDDVTFSSLGVEDGALVKELLVLGERRPNTTLAAGQAHSICIATRHGTLFSCGENLAGQCCHDKIHEECNVPTLVVREALQDAKVIQVQLKITSVNIRGQHQAHSYAV